MILDMITDEAAPTLEIDQIRTDGGTQMRAALNPATVEEYRQAMENYGGWGEFPPAAVFFDGEAHWLGDAFHRVAAYRLTAFTAPVPADVRPGTRRDAILHAAGANARHGLRRSNADKRRAVQALLNDDEWGQWSDREIARRCSVGHPLVAQMRADLTGRSSSETPEDRTYITKHGTKATMKTGNIGNSSNATGSATYVPADGAGDGTVGPTKCSVCNKTLTYPAHVKAGIGPVCAAHMEEAGGSNVTPAKPVEIPATLAEDRPLPDWVTGGVTLSISMQAAKDLAVNLHFLPDRTRYELAGVLDAAGVGESEEVTPPALDESEEIAKIVMPPYDWRDRWTHADDANYDGLPEWWEVEQIQRPRVALRLMEEETDIELRVALLDRYEELSR